MYSSDGMVCLFVMMCAGHEYKKNIIITSTHLPPLLDKIVVKENTNAGRRGRKIGAWYVGCDTIYVQILPEQSAGMRENR